MSGKIHPALSRSLKLSALPIELNGFDAAFARGTDFGLQTHKQLGVRLLINLQVGYAAS